MLGGLGREEAVGVDWIRGIGARGEMGGRRGVRVQERERRVRGEKSKRVRGRQEEGRGQQEGVERRARRE